MREQLPALEPYLKTCGIIDTERLSDGVDIFFVTSGFVILLAPILTRSISGPLGAVAIVLGMASLELRRGGVAQVRWLALLGDASYSLYLTHIFSLGALRVVWLKAGIVGLPGAISFAVTAMVVTSVLALAAYQFVEMPLTRLVKGLVQKLNTGFSPLARPVGVASTPTRLLAEVASRDFSQ